MCLIFVSSEIYLFNHKFKRYENVVTLKRKNRLLP